MKDIKSIILGFILLILITTGIFSVLLDVTGEFIKFILWLFQLSLTDFGLSPTIEIIVKSSTFVLSYSIVGIIFNAIGLFDSNLMKFVYFVISTLIGFALSYVIMVLQKHIIIISWSILGLAIVIATMIFVIYLRQKRNDLKG
jgi:bacteriorhodopsin